MNKNARSSSSGGVEAVASPVVDDGFWSAREALLGAAVTGCCVRPSDGCRSERESLCERPAGCDEKMASILVDADTAADDDALAVVCSGLHFSASAIQSSAANSVPPNSYFKRKYVSSQRYTLNCKHTTL